MTRGHPSFNTVHFFRNLSDHYSLTFMVVIYRLLWATLILLQALKALLCVCMCVCVCVEGGGLLCFFADYSERWGGGGGGRQGEK